MTIQRTCFAAASLAAVATAIMPSAAQAQWQAADNETACMQYAPPSKEAPAVIGLAGDGGPWVMAMFVSKNFPSLREGMGYRGTLRFDNEETSSIAAIQRPNEETVMMMMMLPVEKLDIWARSKAIDVRLDGRRMVNIAPKGRVESVAAFQKCLSNLPQQAKSAAGQPRAGQPRAGRPPASSSQQSASPRQNSPRAPSSDPLAAALAAGERAAGNEPTRRGNPQVAQAPTTAYPQGEADTLLMMMRMNNRLMNNGGNMADPSMGAVMTGWEY